jgi:hypothetical protein
MLGQQRDVVECESSLLELIGVSKQLINPIQIQAEFFGTGDLAAQIATDVGLGNVCDFDVHASVLVVGPNRAAVKR